MKKLVTGTFAALCLVAANGYAQEGAKVWGFADIIYTAVDESADSPFPGGTNSTEGKFGADGEVDFSLKPANGVTARVDVNLNLTAGSGQLEQAMFIWDLPSKISVIGGVFNNPIGADAEDAVDMDFTTHSAVYGILDNQTALNGNNIAGVAIAGNLGPVKATLGLLNDLGQTDEKNSIAIVLNHSPIKDLNLELGFVTQADQADNPNSAEDVLDFNIKYGMNNITLGLDFLSPSEIIDNAYTIWAGYDFGNGLGAKLRYETVSWDGNIDDTTATTAYVSYQAAKNLAIALEFKSGDDVSGLSGVTGINDGSLTLLEFITTF